LEEKDYNKVIEKTKALGEVARDLECSTAQLSLAWCLRNEHVSTVITGASRVQQVAENLQSLNLVQKLTPAVLERCVVR
jgi:aryl-alcohol dehydrogenase-like predicted oxidoreductase